MAIDRAVLLPGQELMERMDKEYERTGHRRPRGEVEEEMRKEEGTRREEVRGEGKDLGQEKGMQEKIGEDPS